MKRKISLLLSLLLACTFVTTVHAQSQQFTEGTDYVLTKKVLPTQTKNKIEVAELFWYRCPHCYSLEPYVKQWQETAAENVDFVMIPAVFSDRWEFSARVFYTFEALGLVKALNDKYFYAIHEDKKTINTAAALAAWVEEQGGNADNIIKTFSSFAVENKINFAKSISLESGATGVPAMIIDGRYLTNTSLAGGADNLFKVVDFLVDKVAQERAN